MLPTGQFNPFNIYTGLFVPKIILQNSNLSGNAKLVYAQLLTMTDSSGKIVKCSYTDIAESIGVSYNTVLKAVEDLFKYRIISITKNKLGNSIISFNHLHDDPNKPSTVQMIEKKQAERPSQVKQIPRAIPKNGTPVARLLP